MNFSYNFTNTIVYCSGLWYNEHVSLKSEVIPMINPKFKALLSGKSVIRELSEYATERGREIGYENVFDYSLGNPSVPCTQSFTDAMIELLENSNPVAIHGYSPSLGITSVRQAVAESLNRRFGTCYETKHIFMTCGAAGAVAHAVRCVTVLGDEVLTFAPFFPEYTQYVNQTGAVLKVVPANTQDFQINFQAFEEMLTEKVAAVLINTPNNPSGIVYTSDTLTRLADILRSKQKQYGHDIFLISDEPYREIVFSGVDAPFVAKFYDNTLTCYSFSKSLSLPGERIGYIAVNPKAYETNMNLIYNKLVELGFTVVKPGGTFYIFPKALEKDANVFCMKAKKYDLILVPADNFGCPGYFRMAYCIDTEKVKRSLDVLEKFVRQEYFQ